MGRSYRIVARNPAYLAYLGITSASYAGLFAWISGAAFVLQNLYGLTPFDFGVAFALGSVGYMTGSALAARIVVRLGLDGVLGVGGCACAVGGLGMVGGGRIRADVVVVAGHCRSRSILPASGWCCRKASPAR